MLVQGDYSSLGLVENNQLVQEGHMSLALVLRTLALWAHTPELVPHTLVLLVHKLVLVHHTLVQVGYMLVQGRHRMVQAPHEGVFWAHMLVLMVHKLVLLADNWLLAWPLECHKSQEACAQDRLALVLVRRAHCRWWAPVLVAHTCRSHSLASRELRSLTPVRRSNRTAPPASSSSSCQASCGRSARKCTPQA